MPVLLSGKHWTDSLALDASGTRPRGREETRKSAIAMSEVCIYIQIPAPAASAMIARCRHECIVFSGLPLIRCVSACATLRCSRQMIAFRVLVWWLLLSVDGGGIGVVLTSFWSWRNGRSGRFRGCVEPSLKQQGVEEVQGSPCRQRHFETDWEFQHGVVGLGR